MLLDMMHANYLHEEYERRLKAEQLVRLALKARAERTDATPHPLGRLLRLVARLAMRPWHLDERTMSRWSSQQDAMRSIPMKHQL